MPDKPRQAPGMKWRVLISTKRPNFVIITGFLFIFLLITWLLIKICQQDMLINGGVIYEILLKLLFGGTQTTEASESQKRLCNEINVISVKYDIAVIISNVAQYM